MIRPATAADAAIIAEIYNHYVLNSTITFEEHAVGADEMAQRIQETAEAKLPWLVIEKDGRVKGYAYASKWKGRCAYRYSVEGTVYLAPDAGRQGLGRTVYSALLQQLQKQSFHTVIGGIALPNAASIALHERLGFAQIAQFREVGFKMERWIDVGYWQLIFPH